MLIAGCVQESKGPGGQLLGPFVCLVSIVQWAGGPNIRMKSKPTKTMRATKPRAPVKKHVLKDTNTDLTHLITDGDYSEKFVKAVEKFHEAFLSVSQGMHGMGALLVGGKKKKLRRAVLRTIKNIKVMGKAAATIAAQLK